MPKHSTQTPVSLQLPLLPEEASLIRADPDRNAWRYYRMEIWRDLFGRASCFASGAASAPKVLAVLISIRIPVLNAPARLLLAKRLRGYVDRRE